MSGILFLAHRLPFPPDRGDKIRSHNILKALARLGPVHVGCFAESASDKAHEPELARIAASYCMPLRNKRLPLAGVEGLVRGRAVSLSAFHHPTLASWVEERLADGEIDTVYVFSGQMGQYVPAEWTGRVIVDLVDVDSAKFEAYADKAAMPLRWLHAREARLLAREEARLAARAERTLLVSEAEADLLRSRSADGRIEALGNGIDAVAFDPALVKPRSELTCQSGPHLVFTGQMDYPPNVDAALRVIERLLPALRVIHSTAQFHVVGRAPTPALCAHDGNEGCRVWGEVPDVRPFLAAADLVLAPLTIARGVQNKVLEALAMACPVLLTSGAATGIGAEDGVHFAVADSDADLVERALALIANKAAATAMGASARRLVLERMSWSATLARLPEIVGRVPGPGGARCGLN
jgi:sugar transferase (PEP-CTERM/EpsH1 system associated)